MWLERERVSMRLGMCFWVDGFEVPCFCLGCASFVGCRGGRVVISRSRAGRGLWIHCLWEVCLRSRGYVFCHFGWIKILLSCG